MGRIVAPRPGVAVPEMRQYMDWSRFGGAINGGNTAQDIFLVSFCVFYKNIEVLVLCKRIPQRLDKLKFGGFPPSALIFFLPLRRRVLPQR